MTRVNTQMTAERPNRAAWKMTAAEARGIIRDMEREVPSVARRKRMAAFYAKNIAGRLSDEAIEVYREYSVS